MQRPLTQHIRPGLPPLTFKEYERVGGYEAARTALGMAPQAVQDLVKASGLRGRGGAGFPTGAKWALAREADGTGKTIICNADEGDPGAYMDRKIGRAHV